MADKKNDVPALFATIHFRSDQRPDGFTDEEIARLNEVANAKDPRPIPRPKTGRKGRR